MKKQKFIKYINWGFDDVYLNLLYSYFKGWTDDGKNTFVSNKKLAEIFCCSITTIKTKIKTLEDMGYIERNLSKNRRVRYVKLGAHKSPRPKTK